MIRNVPPRQRHVPGLIQLSRQFASEAWWAADIPIGQIDTEEIATNKLFGEDVVLAWVAETDAGEMAGYVGVYRHHGRAHLSVLVGAAFRGQGVARQLVEHAFNQVPRGTVVEAWVGAFNQKSLAAMPQMGFRPNRVIAHGDHKVHILTRRA